MQAMLHLLLCLMCLLPCPCCLVQEAAHEESQKYKEGKFILERVHVVETSPSTNGSSSGRSSSPGIQHMTTPLATRVPPLRPLIRGGYWGSSNSESDSY